MQKTHLMEAVTVEVLGLIDNNDVGRLTKLIDQLVGHLIESS
jgi:hypothetical protein